MAHNKPKDIIEDLKLILRSNEAGTQEAIKSALHKAGHDVNQSKISRLLRKLGAIKITNEHHEVVYTLPYDPTPLSTKGVLPQLVLNITKNESLIIIRTNPGSASLIGRLLDHNSLSLGILGTVAGDDTLFIAPVSVKNINKTFETIQLFIATME